MEKIKKILKENELIYPDYSKLNIIDLMKLIYKREGIDFENYDNLNKLNNIIPKNSHTLFVISDGTGTNLIDKLDDNSLLKKNKKTDLITIFPSTTACVLTSVVTASFPQEHGIWGWFNHDSKNNLDYCPLLFAERESNKSLTEFNIKSEDIFTKKSLLKEIKTKVNVLFPSYIYDSIYSKYVVDDNNRYPYDNYEDIIKFMDKNCSLEKESFTYLYLPDIDTLEHENGIDNDIVINKLKEIENLISEISKIKNLTIIFTADHGQINAKEGVKLDFSKYNKFFYALPSIDVGTASFYVKGEFEREFVDEFNNDFKGKMFLFSKDELFKNKFFGLKDFEQDSLNNLGEYVSICKKGYFLINDTNSENDYSYLKGIHSGLTKEEMMVPLIVINTNES